MTPPGAPGLPVMQTLHVTGAVGLRSAAAAMRWMPGGQAEGRSGDALVRVSPAPARPESGHRLGRNREKGGRKGKGRVKDREGKLLESSRKMNGALVMVSPAAARPTTSTQASAGESSPAECACSRQHASSRHMQRKAHGHRGAQLARWRGGGRSELAVSPGR